MSAGKLFVSTGSGHHYAIVEVSSILYLTAAESITYLFTTAGVVDATLPLHYFEDTLPGKKFCRIHETHLVALDRIISFDASTMLLPGALLPIGPSYLHALRASIRVLEDSHWFINGNGKLEQGTGELQ